MLPVQLPGTFGPKGILRPVEGALHLRSFRHGAPASQLRAASSQRRAGCAPAGVFRGPRMRPRADSLGTRLRGHRGRGRTDRPLATSPAAATVVATSPCRWPRPPSVGDNLRGTCDTPAGCFGQGLSQPAVATVGCRERPWCEQRRPRLGPPSAAVETTNEFNCVIGGHVMMADRPTACRSSPSADTLDTYFR